MAVNCPLQADKWLTIPFLMELSPKDVSQMSNSDKLQKPLMNINKSIASWNITTSVCEQYNVDYNHTQLCF